MNDYTVTIQTAEYRHLCEANAKLEAARDLFRRLKEYEALDAVKALLEVDE